jgi:hypothetical protein
MTKNCKMTNHARASFGFVIHHSGFVISRVLFYCEQEVETDTSTYHDASICFLITGANAV